MTSELKYAFKCNKIMFCYLLYAIIICLNDYFISLFDLDYVTSFIMSGILIVLAAIFYLKRNKVDWEKFPINKYDRILILMIVAECTVRAIMPDSCYDTLNYHLYYQKFFDRDFINYDFFPMRSFNAQTFGAIGDRLFYGFRYFLGYRMGTLLNTLVIVLIYFQIKQLFCMVWTEFGHECQSRWSEAFISIGTFMCMMTETTYACLSNYMVDYLAVPFLLEIVRTVLCNEDETETSVTHTAGYLCIMSGIAVGIKITNCLIIFPLAVFFLFKQRKKINIRCICCSLLALLYPLLLYLIISYRMTRNPVFPYLNQIFQSPYFSTTRSPNDFSAFNSRFGPVKITEYLLWPFYMFKSPERTADYAMYSGRLLILFLTFIIAVPCEYKKFTRKIKYLFFYGVYCYVLFLSVIHGYMRYIPILELLGSVLAFSVLAEWIYHRGSIMKKRLGIVITFFLLCQISLATGSFLIKNCEWSWRSIKDIPRMILNLPYVFRDHGVGEDIDREILEDIQCFVVPDASGSLAAELKGDVPIIGINSYFATTNEYTAQLLEQRLRDVSEQNIYSVTNRDGWTDNFEIFNSRGLALEEIITIQPDFWDKIYCLPLMKLKSVDNTTNIKYETFSSGEELFTIDIADDIDAIDIFIGDIVSERKRTDNEYQVSVIGRNRLTGEEEIILQDVAISQTGRYYKESVNLSKHDFDQIEVRKIVEDDEDAKETYQIVLQEYDG